MEDKFNYISEAPEVLLLAVCVLLISIKLKSKYGKILSIFFLCMVLYFFRGWNGRIENVDSSILYAPCDGVVKKIIENETHIHIMIFLNIHNIHVQYVPFDCTVKEMKYHKGKFHPAYILEKSQYNERMEYTLHNNIFGNVKFIQIAGQVARRIKSFVAVEDKLDTLSPIGLIKFGSRCDLIIPKNVNIQLLIKENDRIRIGSSVLRLK